MSWPKCIVCAIIATATFMIVIAAVMAVSVTVVDMVGRLVPHPLFVTLVSLCVVLQAVWIHRIWKR